MAQLRSRGYCLPKAGNAATEIEDAFAVAAEHNRFAVSDGASESAFAGPWAQLLVDQYVVGPGRWTEWLPEVQRRWHAAFAAQNMSWFVETKFLEGAYATLLGLTLGNRNGAQFRPMQASAVGDSCLFQVRGDELLLSFPLQKSAAFGNAPHLLGSRRQAWDDLERIRKRIRGECQPGDLLILATDSLAQWFLVEVEKGGRPWRELGRRVDPEEFARWIDHLRKEKAMRNDDVTLILVEDPPE